MCLFLLVKVHSLEKQIETITKVSDSVLSKHRKKEVKTTKAPKKATTAEPTIKPTDDTTTKKVYLTLMMVRERFTPHISQFRKTRPES